MQFEIASTEGFRFDRTVVHHSNSVNMLERNLDLAASSKSHTPLFDMSTNP